MGRLLILYFLKPPTAAATATATAAVTTADLFSLLLLLTALLSFLTPPAHALQDADTANPTFLDIASSDNPSPSPPRPPPPPNAGNTTTSQPSSFRPSIAIIVGVFTTLFSITFLILLYAKHCKSGALVIVGANSNSRPSGPAQRKNSGIDRSVIESLPVFRFSSLRGQKDGLECAVCLTRFEPTEVLRLLPKCKHAFHVECVDTWLDAHSTCPLCRYRVDPEDVLLIDDAAKLLHSHNSYNNDVVVNIENDPSGFRRVSGRHSFAGEHRPGHQNIILASFRRSLDSWTSFKKKSEQPPTPTTTTNVGCFDRPRKDGLLLGHDRTRLEHRIIVSPWSGSRPSGVHQRWSDVQPSDLLYLRSEMIMSEGLTRQQIQQNENNNVQQEAAGVVGPGGGLVGIDGNRRSWSCGNDDGRSVINTRSVSEITGLSRFSSRGTMLRSNEQQQQQRQLKLVARWLAWVSSLSRPTLRTERTTFPTIPPPIC